MTVQRDHCNFHNLGGSFIFDFVENLVFVWELFFPARFNFDIDENIEFVFSPWWTLGLPIPDLDDVS